MCNPVFVSSKTKSVKRNTLTLINPIVNLAICTSIEKGEMENLYHISFKGCSVCWYFNNEKDRDNTLESILELDCIRSFCI